MEYTVHVEMFYSEAGFTGIGVLCSTCPQLFTRFGTLCPGLILFFLVPSIFLDAFCCLEKTK